MHAADAATNAGASTDIETFDASWPGVLLEMKDYLDLWFLVLGGRRSAGAVRVYISKALVAQERLQPHVREFRASIARIPGCALELKGTDEAAHRIEIEYRSKP